MLLFNNYLGSDVVTVAATATLDAVGATTIPVQNELPPNDIFYLVFKNSTMTIYTAERNPAAVVKAGNNVQKGSTLADCDDDYLILLYRQTELVAQEKIKEITSGNEPKTPEEEKVPEEETLAAPEAPEETPVTTEISTELEHEAPSVVDADKNLLMKEFSKHMDEILNDMYRSLGGTSRLVLACESDTDGSTYMFEIRYTTSDTGLTEVRVLSRDKSTVLISAAFFGDGPVIASSTIWDSVSQDVCAVLQTAVTNRG